MFIRDSLATRLTAAIIAAMLVGAALDAAFSHVVAAWSRPSLSQSGWLQIEAELARTLDATAAPARAQLAAAASNSNFVVRWQPAAPLPAAGMARLRRLPADDVPPPLAPALDLRARTLLLIRPDEGPDVSADLQPRAPRQPYVMFAALKDGSWVTFTLSRRTWGGGARLRRMVIAALFGLSAMLIAVAAARWLARPLAAFNREVETLGIGRAAAKMTPRGPAELRRTIDVINAMQARIGALIRARTLLLATITHDLRMPLARLKLRVELLHDRDAARALLRDVDQMAALVGTVIAMLRDTFEDAPRQCVDLGALAQVVAEDFADQGVPIPVTVQGLTLTKARPEAVERALRNILDNAVRYAREVEVRVYSQDAQAWVEVCDRGPGVPEAGLASLFDPFTRFDDDSARGDGAGLGLTSAHDIAASHGGGLVAVNREGGGLCVSLRLPMADPGFRAAGAD